MACITVASSFASISPKLLRDGCNPKKGLSDRLSFISKSLLADLNAVSPKGGTAHNPSIPPSKLITISRPSLLVLVNPKFGKPVRKSEAGTAFIKSLRIIHTSIISGEQSVAIKRVLSLPIERSLFRRAGILICWLII